ncbi:MAG: type II secretion system F family protein [Proteobacteria bacterium]|nr:type II secretion system F family protein [Pseudomonadota bacterium]
MALSSYKSASSTEKLFAWSGIDRNRHKQVGEMRAASANVVMAALRRQGITMTKVNTKKLRRGKTIRLKDLMTFSRQLTAMLKAGVPLVQALSIVGSSHPNPSMGALVLAIRDDLETGTSFSNALRKYPRHFNALYCDLVAAGEDSGTLELVINRLADYQEKTYEIRKKIKGALTYPIAVLTVAAVVVTVIMIFVVPVFSETFKSFGAALPAPTLAVIAISNFFIHEWYVLLGITVGGGYFGLSAWKRSAKFQAAVDRWLLKLPVFGNLIEKGALARWSRTLATMFSAGVPMVDAMDAVAGAAGNDVFRKATIAIQTDITTGTSMAVAMQSTGVFPPLMLQMTQIGEETGSMDDMMSKVADFYESEVDEIAKNLSSLMEPMIISILGILIGGLVIALYLPIFKLGAVVK